NLPGLRFSNQPFIPVSGLYAGQRCGGVAVKVTDRAGVRSMRMGLEIAALLQKKYPQQFDSSKILQLIGNDQAVHDLQAGVSPQQIVSGWAGALAAFDQVRRKYLLYP